MTRRLAVSVYNRINSQSFKSNPYILNKISYNLPEFNQNTQNELKYDFKAGVTSHPSVKLHPVIEYSLVANKLLTKLNEIQESSYLSIVFGKDVTIHSPIGTGKTIAYLLPILNNVYHIHDMLESLMFKNNSNSTDSETSLRNLAMGWNNKLGHARLPSKIENFRQDLGELETLGSETFKNYKGGSTMEKLLEVLYNQEPRNLKLLGLPSVPSKIWKKRSKESIYRNIMTNPLGSVRCVVILVPTKDLVSQVVSYIEKIDILGRLSIQTLTHIPVIPNNNTLFTHSAIKNINSQNDQDSTSELISKTDENESDSPVPEDDRTMFYEDELKMIENVPTKQIEDKEVKTVAMNMGNRINKIKIKYLGKENQAIDGLVPECVTYKKQPIFASDTIQWGSVDVVVSTVQSFAFEILSSSRRGMYPICLVFDEVDMLFENNANRSSILEIISKLRPRPSTYNPLVDIHKRRAKTPPPVQIVNVGSTINFGGVQTCGNMIFERFNTSKLVMSKENHVIDSELFFEKTNPDGKLATLVRVILNNPVKKTVVFCSSLENCRLVYDTLKKNEWPVMAFHSKSALSTRLAILKTFEDEEPRILVATDLVTRGINLEVNHVINFDFPTSSEVFFHRIKSSKAKVTSIVTDNSELSTQISHFAEKKKPISQILSRKRSLRKKMDRLKLEKMNSSNTRVHRGDDKSTERGFFESRFEFTRNLEGESKYRRIPIKKRLASLLHNYG